MTNRFGVLKDLAEAVAASPYFASYKLAEIAAPAKPGHWLCGSPGIRGCFTLIFARWENDGQAILLTYWHEKPEVLSALFKKKQVPSEGDWMGSETLLDDRHATAHCILSQLAFQRRCAQRAETGQLRQCPPPLAPCR